MKYGKITKEELTKIVEEVFKPHVKKHVYYANNKDYNIKAFNHKEKE